MKQDRILPIMSEHKIPDAEQVDAEVLAEHKKASREFLRANHLERLAATKSRVIRTLLEKNAIHNGIGWILSGSVQEGPTIASDGAIDFLILFRSSVNAGGIPYVKLISNAAVKWREKEACITEEITLDEDQEVLRFVDVAIPDLDEMNEQDRVTGHMIGTEEILGVNRAPITLFEDGFINIIHHSTYTPTYGFYGIEGQKVSVNPFGRYNSDNPEDEIEALDSAIRFLDEAAEYPVLAMCAGK